MNISRFVVGWGSMWSRRNGNDFYSLSSALRSSRKGEPEKTCHPNAVKEIYYCRAKKLLWSLSFVPRCVDMTMGHTCSLRRIDVITVHHVDVYIFNGVQSRDFDWLTLLLSLAISSSKHFEVNITLNPFPSKQPKMPNPNTGEVNPRLEPTGPGPVDDSTSLPSMCPLSSASLLTFDLQMAQTASHPPQPKRSQQEM